MGYRSTFVTDDTSVKLPQWFVGKWEGSVWINPERTLPIASKAEFKCYGHWSDLVNDLSRVLREGGSLWPDHTIHLIFLHEDGATTQWLISSQKAEIVREDSSVL